MKYVIRTAAAVALAATAGQAVGQTVIYSSIATSPTSLVPGLGGARFSDTDFASISLSPNGNWWVLDAFTDQDSSMNEVLIRGSGSNGASGVVFAQEGTAHPGIAGRLHGGLDTLHGVGNNGTVAYGGDVDGSTADDDHITTWDGTTHSVIAQEGGDASAVMGAGAVWDTLDSAQFTTNGIGFRATGIDNVPTDNDAALVRGGSVTAQEDIDVPGGQLGGATETWDVFDFEDTKYSADGSSYIAQGDLHGSTSSDDVVVVNGQVVLQEDATVGSLAGLANAPTRVEMGSNGDWSVRGSMDTGQDYVMVNNVVVAATGDTISPSSTETYSDADFSSTFFMSVVNGNGDYLIGGLTDSDDDLSNAVIMLNGQTEVLREGDAVDLDGNGLFDDDVFVNIFHNDDIVFTDDLTLYALVSLRDGTGAEVGEAMLTLVVPSPSSVALLGLGGMALTRRRR